jgi:hypothetical protein
MRLESNVSSDRSWVYHSPADLSDEEPRAETFAIRFGNSERMYKAPSLSLSLARSLSIITQQKLMLCYMMQYNQQRHARSRSNSKVCQWHQRLVHNKQRIGHLLLWRAAVTNVMTCFVCFLYQPTAAQKDMSKTA